jgi:hypothetical protein
MATSKEQITGTAHGGIYYTDQITGTTGQGTLTAEMIIGTTVAALIDTRVEQVWANHLRPPVVLIRNKA